MALATELAGHGGRLCVARALYPRAPEPWIDLSTGINPEPYPAPYASASARGRLPTPDEVRELEATAARAFGVYDAERIVAVAGSEAALRLMPYGLGSRAAVITGPTYSSHATAWRHAGVRVNTISARGVAAEAGADTALAAGAAAVILVNPNNPDGAVISRERLLSLHDDVASREGYLVVDEAFADVEPGCSVSAVAGNGRYPRLVVLRSFGKFYGLAGVRLGFVVGAPSVIARFRELLGDWPVSADAIAAGVAAYADHEWAERTRERLRRASQRVDELLKRNGFDIVGGTSLFRLARCDHARDRFENLLRAGILARPFDHDPTLLRFGLPHEPEAWQRLTEALRSP